MRSNDNILLCKEYEIINHLRNIKSFWGLEDIPVSSIKFISQVNGGFVDYYASEDMAGGITLYKPNPNSELYISYNHFKQIKIRG